MLNDEPLCCTASDNEVDEVLSSTLLYSAVLSSVRTAPILTWRLQISLWQKRQNETWMNSARCGVFMRSGSRASQKRPRRTGSHSGRGLCLGLLLMVLNSLNSALFLSLSLLCVQLCVNMCRTCLLFHRSKTYVFEEFLFTWQDRLRKLEQPTAMSVKLQGEVDKYKVECSRVNEITCHCYSLKYFFALESHTRPSSRA